MTQLIGQAVPDLGNDNAGASAPLEAIKLTLKNPVIFDGRNLYDPKFVRGLGIEYFAIGR